MGSPDLLESLPQAAPSTEGPAYHTPLCSSINIFRGSSLLGFPAAPEPEIVKRGKVPPKDRVPQPPYLQIRPEGGFFHRKVNSAICV